MSAKLIVGLDGNSSGERAVEHAKRMAKLIGKCTLELVYVIEWSPFSFQTPQENENRHKRREEEIEMAEDRVLRPALESLKKDGFTAKGHVRHGDAANILNEIAVKEKAELIIVARSSDGGITERFFGSVTSNLVMTASVPVTVVA